jgi:cytochrome c oxidase subunit II
VDPQIITTVEHIDPIFYYLLGISIFLLIGITVAMIFFAVRYHRSRHPEPASKVSSNLLLEITWTVIPTFIALSMFYFGWAGYLALHNVPEGAMEVQVTGRMWSWTFTYENGRTSDRLHVPVNTPVRVGITSEDVLHNFYIPAFRVKKDAVPGMETFVWFIAPQLGSYDIFCAEYCGLLHSSMITTVEVLPEEDFLAWYEAEAPMDPAAAGRELLGRHGCLGCHSLDGSPGAGPTLQGLYGREVVVTVNGQRQTVVADEEYIRESILDPNAMIVEGYPPIMPSYQGRISEEELAGMIAFFADMGEATDGSQQAKP